MADDLRERLEAFTAFANEVMRNLDTLSVEQREIIRRAVERMDAERIAALREQLGPSS